MLETIDKILNFSQYLMFPGFILIGIGTIMIISTKFSKKEIKQIRWGSIFLFIGIFTFIPGFGFTAIFNKKIKNDLLQFIEKNESQIEVVLNDSLLIDSNKCLYFIKQTDKVDAHHSHDINRIDLDLKIKNIVWHISLSQDSEYKDEFWVFVNDYKISSKQEIGRIRSIQLYEYLLDFNIKGFKTK